MANTSQDIELWLPGIYQNGLNTNQPVNFASTLDVTGAATFAGAVTLSSTLATGALTVTGSISATTTIKAASGTTDTAGGVAAFQMGSVGTNLGIFYGSGAPSIAAHIGSLYLRTDAATTLTAVYVNLGGGTSWVTLN